MRTRKANQPATSTPTPPTKKAAAKVSQKSTPKSRRPAVTPVEGRETGLAATALENPAEGVENVGRSKPVAEIVLDEVLNEKAVSKQEEAKPPVSNAAGAGSGDVAVSKEYGENVLEASKEGTVASDVKDGASVDVAMEGANIEVHLKGGQHLEKDSSEKEDQRRPPTTTGNEGAEVDDDGGANPAKDECEQVQKKDDETEDSENRAAEGCIEAQQALHVSDRQRRKKSEVFVGGLDKEATEEDLRNAFEKVGEIVEIRLMKNFQTGKNKGYAFVRYTTMAEAKRAIKELSNTQIRGKQCGVAPLEENDTIFLGNIDKNWKKDDVIKKLEEIGIENIDNVVVIDDPHNVGLNRGFAFLELETYKDAQIAYKKLQKKDAFGKDQAIKVAWAQPFNDPDEDVMAQVKSVFIDGMPQSWNEEQVKEYFGKFGEIERVVLARNMQSAKRKDFGFVNYTTRESAILCIETINKADDLIEGDSKVKLKVSLAKPVQKGKIGKGDSKGKSKGGSTVVNKGGSQGNVLKLDCSNTAKGAHGGKGLLGKGGQQKPPSATHEIIQILREQAAWGPEPMAISAGVHLGNSGFGDASSLERARLCASYLGGHEYSRVVTGAKRAYDALAEHARYADSRGYPRARLEGSIPGGASSYGWAIRGQSPLPNVLIGGSSQQQFNQHPGLAAAVGHLYPTGSAARVRSGSKKGSRLLQRATAHGARRGHGSGSTTRN